jgi:hypothetical protein
VRDGHRLATAGHCIRRIVCTLFALVTFLWITCGGGVVTARGCCYVVFVRLDVHKSRGLGLCFDLGSLHICIRLRFSRNVIVFFVVFAGGRRRGRGIDV